MEDGGEGAAGGGGGGVVAEAEEEQLLSMGGTDEEKHKLNRVRRGTFNFTIVLKYTTVFIFDYLTIHTFRPTSFYLQLQIHKYRNTNTCTWVLPRSSRGRTGEMVRGPTWPKSPSPRSARSHSRASGPGGS